LQLASNILGSETRATGIDLRSGARISQRGTISIARQTFNHSAKTAEAELMDWADDIAYSVHDLEDFHRCGVIPWHRILGGDHAQQLIARAESSWHDGPLNAEGRLREALRNLEDLLTGSFNQLLREPYEGARHQRQQLRTLTSLLIGRYVHAASLREPDRTSKCVVIEPDKADEVLILKQITRDYIISNPSLAAQQKGQKHLLDTLFERIYEDSKERVPIYLPHRLRYLWDHAGNETARFVADCISSLTEAEAIGLHARLEGVSSGSVLDPIVRWKLSQAINSHRIARSFGGDIGRRLRCAAFIQSIRNTTSV
jgi:dGTPase